MAVDVALAPGGQAIVADQGVGLEVVDVALPAQPRSLGGLEALPGSYRLAVAGATAYVVDRDLGLRVVDLIQPAAPRLLATLAKMCIRDRVGAGHHGHGLLGRRLGDAQESPGAGIVHQHVQMCIRDRRWTGR